MRLLEREASGTVDAAAFASVEGALAESQAEVNKNHELVFNRTFCLLARCLHATAIMTSTTVSGVLEDRWLLGPVLSSQ